MERLDPSARRRFLDDHPGWTLDGETLRRTFTFPDFIDSVGFVTRVAMAAEVADHHPDIDIRWNKVTLALTTHEADGLTSRDTDLASLISSRVGSETA